MYYFDANIFIFPQIYDLSIESAAKAKEYLTSLTEGEIKGCTSTLTWDEIVYIVRKVGGKRNSLKAGTKFLRFPNLKIVDVDLKIISKAQKLVETYSLKPRDAIHAACALIYCDGEIITSDSDFDVVEEVKRKF
ncbi:MAG: twitching motility protein PilT [Theionarchaea archaeon DG-70-1]|nr:MAG: twitching motility protein PilT [Theionarchaea archaeon DG-70-1]